MLFRALSEGNENWTVSYTPTPLWPCALSLWVSITCLPESSKRSFIREWVLSFDWVNLTLALKWYYAAPVKDHVCPRRFCLPRSLNKACNSSSPFYLTIQQSLLQEQRWLHSTKLPYILQRTGFSSLITDRQDTQTDRHIAACHLLLFLAHTGMAVYFPVVQGLLASCLPSVSCRWVTRDARQDFLRTPTKAISDSGEGPASFLPPHSLTFTEMNLLALNDSRCQLPPQQRQKKSNWVNNFQE